jgi:hypothetical protein
MKDIDGQVILLIIFVVISAIKWAIEKIKKPVEHSGDEHEIPENLENLYENFREEIRQRQTTTGKRTETATPVAAPPPLPQPSASTVQATATARPAESALWQRPQKVVLSAEQQAAASRFQQLGSSKRKSSAQSHVRTLLSNPSSARQAIILTEILGKPKSLQNG